ncbi:MAG: hypothetical protein K8E24_005400 [Methanobacterium paludis]|nr:hypothetical protein [Methanobacterium paludis]
MVSEGLIVDKGTKYESKVDPLDMARRKYEKYEIPDMCEDEFIFVANAVRLTPMIKSKNGEGCYAYLEFFDDESESKVSTSVNFKYKGDNPTIFMGREEPKEITGSRLFQMIRLITGDKDSTYFKINYKILQDTIKTITKATVESVYVELEKADFYTLNIKSIEMDE